MGDFYLAKVEGTGDLRFDDHCTFVLDITFHTEQGFHQGLGFSVDDEFIRRFMMACGKDSLSECIGTIVRVESTLSRICSIGPVARFASGKLFDINEWSERCKRRYEVLNPLNLYTNAHPHRREEDGDS